MIVSSTCSDHALDVATKEVVPVEPADGWSPAESGMWADGVVVVQPGMHCLVPVCRTLERPGIGPFADAALDEPLGLAVGLGGVGPGSLVGDATGFERITEGEAFISRSVVGHDALDGDAVVFEPSKAAFQEGGCVFLAFARQQLSVGQARAVIDGDVQVFPAKATSNGTPVALPGAVAGDAVSDAVDAAELLDV